jgi:hypothetical protein
MDNLVNLAEYRAAKEKEKLAYLRDLLDEIMASMPPMDDGPIVIVRSDQMEWADLFPQTNLDGYETPPDQE